MKAALSGYLLGTIPSADQWIDARADHCTYYTTDTISGKHADQVIETTGTWVQAGFDAVANALKERAELLWASSAANQSHDAQLS